jgi:hypothetical protein
MKYDYPGRGDLFPKIGRAHEELEEEVKQLSTLDLAKRRQKEVEWTWKLLIIDAELQRRK